MYEFLIIAYLFTFTVVRIAVIHIRNNPYTRFTVVRITDSYRVFHKLCPHLKQHYLSIINISGQVNVKRSAMIRN